jgi:hypothetical protein
MSYTKRLTIKLEAGNNYVYPVTLNKQSLTVGSASIAEWDNVEVEDVVSMKYQPYYQIITNKADVQKYDYLLNDGTFMRVSTDNLTKLTDTDKANIAGVVFWTKPENLDEGLVGLGYTNGLVVSMNEYTSQWMEKTGVTVGVTNASTNLCGYSDTKNLKEYNDEHPTTPVLAVSVFADEPNVINTSGWYLASAMEMVYLFGGTTATMNDTFDSDDCTTINYYLNSIGGTVVDVDSYNAVLYWTSKEEGDDFAYTVGRFMELYCIGKNYKVRSFHVRPICAF